MSSFVVDANVGFELVNAPRPVDRLVGDEPVAPPLLWPEVRSALHVARWRGLLTEEDAYLARDLLESDIFRERRHRRLGERAWTIADSLGWSKTYDAEYLALSSLLRAPIATFDRRVARAAEHLGIPLYTFK
ncbi:MAG TPA: type II toxin-antitoxin system VapC family toxin [Actinomycetota bacterium]|nr:type II toxin-antitoxin system VapC family toxin [Actinomycetota bacterium]